MEVLPKANIEAAKFSKKAHLSAKIANPKKVTVLTASSGCRSGWSASKSGVGAPKRTLERRRKSKGGPAMWRWVCWQTPSICSFLTKWNAQIRTVKPCMRVTTEPSNLFCFVRFGDGRMQLIVWRVVRGPFRISHLTWMVLLKLYLFLISSPFAAKGYLSCLFCFCSMVSKCGRCTCQLVSRMRCVFSIGNITQHNVAQLK